MEIRRACAEDAHALTKIAFAAKRHWQYPENWIRRWQDALTVTPEYLKHYPVFVATIGGESVGFCSLKFQKPDVLLDHLWVRPSSIGIGVGRRLFEHAEKFARASGAVRMKITGDPHAESFYRRMGATVLGHEPASMDGEERYLPLLEKVL